MAKDRPLVSRLLNSGALPSTDSINNIQQPWFQPSDWITCIKQHQQIENLGKLIEQLPQTILADQGVFDAILTRLTPQTTNVLIPAIRTALTTVLLTVPKGTIDNTKCLLKALTHQSLNYLEHAYKTADDKKEGIEATQLFLKRILYPSNSPTSVSDVDILKQETTNYFQGKGQYSNYRASNTKVNSRSQIFGKNSLFTPNQQPKKLTMDEAFMLNEIEALRESVTQQENAALIAFDQLARDLVAIYSKYEGKNKQRQAQMKSILEAVKKGYEAIKQDATLTKITTANIQLSNEVNAIKTTIDRKQWFWRSKLSLYIEAAICAPTKGQLILS